MVIGGAAGAGADLFGDDAAPGGGFVVLADYFISSRLQRSDLDGGRRFSRNDFLALQRMAFEFLRDGILIVHDQCDFPAGWNLQFPGVDPVILEHNGETLLSQGGIENRKDSQQDNRDAGADEHGEEIQELKGGK
jgi:hypothetical protein